MRIGLLAVGQVARNSAVGPANGGLLAGGIFFAARDSFAIGLLAALVVAFGLQANPLDTWHARIVPSPGITLQGASFCGGLFVAVGSSGSSTNILTSPDGVTWTPRPANTTNSLTAVAWGNGTYVAVGWQDDSYTGVVTSHDGVVWTGQRVATNTALHAITFANDLFVAVGFDHESNNSLVMTSTDGISWSPYPLTNSSAGILEGVTYGNGLFVAAGFGGGPLLVSADGINWTNRGDLIPGGFHRAVSYADGTFVVAGGPQTFCCAPFVSTSTNLDDWTTQLVRGGSHYNSAVAFGAGTWVAVGDSPQIAYSTDTVVWTQAVLPNASLQLSGVAYGKGTFARV